MATLVKRLSLPEAIGLSVSVICPTVTAAFNITLVVQAAGAAAPLAFAIGTVAMVLVALSFMAFTHRVAHAGSAYAYISHTFGSRMGFIAGWCLLLTYVGFATGQAALVGSFTVAALKGVSIDLGSWWVGIGGGAMLVAWGLAFRGLGLGGPLRVGRGAGAGTGSGRDDRHRCLMHLHSYEGSTGFARVGGDLAPIRGFRRLVGAGICNGFLHLVVRRIRGCGNARRRDPQSAAEYSHRLAVHRHRVRIVFYL